MVSLKSYPQNLNTELVEHEDPGLNGSAVTTGGGREGGRLW